MGNVIKKNKRGRPAKYPWASLKMGDNFLMEGVFDSPFSLLKAYNKGSGKPEIYITTRKEANGVRVWRIKKPIPFFNK
jgi:hypothetical protein